MIKSSLDLHRELPAPELEPGETVSRRCTGTIEETKYSFASFTPCNIYLTDRRLLLAVVRKILKEFRFDRIEQMTVVKRTHNLGKKVPQLKISMKEGKTFFVAMRRPDEWLVEIAESGNMKVEKTK